MDLPQASARPVAMSMAFVRTIPESLVLAMLVLLGGALRLLRLGHEPLWVDEGFSWRWAHLPLADLWGAAGRLEYNPPLYYTLQHAALALGDGSFQLRLPSALLSALAIPLGYRLARDLAGRGAALLAALLVALSGPLVSYGQEARGYALLADAWLL